MTATAEQLQTEATDEGLIIRQPPHRWDLLLSEDGPMTLLVHAATAVVLRCPDSPGRVRALELFQAGGEPAVVLAAAVIKRAFGGERVA